MFCYIFGKATQVRPFALLVSFVMEGGEWPVLTLPLIAHLAALPIVSRLGASAKTLS